jgi:heterotetrameric sarcosine oxidase gamma subunit
LVLHVHAYRDPEGVGSRLVRALALTGEATSGRVLDGGSRALLKLSTLDWLVRAEAAWPDLCRSLRTELSDLASVTELSNARTVIRVQGPHAVSVLAQGVSLDLSDLAFPPGGFAQTRCGPFAVLLSRDRSGDRWDLMVHRSYAVSLWEWLLNAGASVGVQVQA